MAWCREERKRGIGVGITVYRETNEIASIKKQKEENETLPGALRGGQTLAFRTKVR